MKHTTDSAQNLASEFIYTKAGTCITIKWRQMGWVPASEEPEIQAKWKYYRSLPMQEPEQCEHQTCQRQMDGSTICN